MESHDLELEFTLDPITGKTGHSGGGGGSSSSSSSSSRRRRRRRGSALT